MKQLLLTAHAIHAGPLILVNRQYPYRESGETALVPVGETPERMERRAAALLSMLMEEIGGWRQITAVSRLAVPEGAAGHLGPVRSRQWPCVYQDLCGGPGTQRTPDRAGPSIWG